MGEWYNSVAQVLISPLVWVLSLAALAYDLMSRFFRKRLPQPTSILITGATSGIGEALAVFYARSGVTLALTGRNVAALEKTAAACSARGAVVHTKACDVTDRSGLAAWIADVDLKAPLDLVFANAGVTESTTQTHEDLEAAARQIFAVNVDGVFNTIFPALPGMTARGKGQIVLLSSLASFGALTGSAAYCASKAAIRVYGDGLRQQLYRTGIRVNVVCPGFVKSPMTDANRFPQPGKVSMEYAINAITEGLAFDDRHIAFPTFTYVASHALGALPSAVRDVFARLRLIPNIAYLRKSRRTGGEGGVVLEASTTEKESQAPTSASGRPSRRKAVA